MIGVYVGGETGGPSPSCLLGIPGKPSAVATTFDGFPMARKGELQGVGSDLGLDPPADCSGPSSSSRRPGRLARSRCSSALREYFALFVLALSMVAGLVESSLLKGLLSGALGCVVTILGNDR